MLQFGRTPPLPHPSKLTSFFCGRKMFHFLKFFPLYLSLMIMISLMILICFVNHLAFFVPPHITCLETRILTVVAFEGIFPLWWTWLAYICRGTSFSRFGAFAADSDYPYYPHHPEPHFLLANFEALDLAQFFCAQLTLPCGTRLYLYTSLVKLFRSRKWQCRIFKLWTIPQSSSEMKEGFAEMSLIKYELH